MLTKLNSPRPAQVLAVLAAMVSLSGLATAQQSGLLPLHPIRRERTPCTAEDPIYKLYRNQYYGYFPTQWRRFPDNWNLRSAETPNAQEELKKNPIEVPKPFQGEEEGEEKPGPAGPGARPPIPNPPPDTDRSPFEMDKPDTGVTPSPGAAPGRRPPTTRGNVPPAATGDSPFDIPDTNAPRAAPMPDGRPQASRLNRSSTPAQADPSTPELAPPGNAPVAPPRTSWNRRNNEARQNDPGPLLSASDAGLPAVEEAATAADSAANEPAQPVANTPPAADPASAPVAIQPAPRRGPISSLFAGLGLNWLRR